MARPHWGIRLALAFVVSLVLAAFFNPANELGSKLISVGWLAIALFGLQATTRSYVRNNQLLKLYTYGDPVRIKQAAFVSFLRIRIIIVLNNAILGLVAIISPASWLEKAVMFGLYVSVSLVAYEIALVYFTEHEETVEDRALSQLRASDFSDQ